ncbi:hypothetical protein A4D02_24820 [Niastella koreensis]|uniref:Uncharacterized protein n=2 Tax=Niastella koreensis TaxID=354356 RepID=G8TFV8_NIAKG|nr:hypothetical protein [Niastella koreensis]AEW00557.1 hypothetical protein Niako_4287 [Niastella koreensis GR20-10]OQP52414.1 hypothetical protein A4D02_24820 [Niastella koreensis]
MSGKQDNKKRTKSQPYVNKKSADLGESKAGSKDSLKKEAPRLERSYSELGLMRSNSVGDLKSLLKHEERNPANSEHTAMAVKDRKYFSVIGVFSREASKNFGKAWQLKMFTGSAEQRMTDDSMTGVTREDIAAKDALQSRTLVSTNLEEQVQALFKNKTVPHVIAVIEGKEERDTFKLKTEVPVTDEEKDPSLAVKSGKKTKSIELGYRKMGFSQGFTSKGAKDRKQNMTLYVRDDLHRAYTWSEVKVARNSEKIPCVAVDYKTKDGKKYRSLIVHIPNIFVKSQTEVALTNAAFSKYAAKVKKEEGVIVTNYLGDTNFKKPFFDNSTPSMGGLLPNKKALNPKSSGAKDNTSFMQNVPLGKGEEGYSVMQPSTSNYIFLTTDGDNKEATDHPSTLNYVAHKSPIADRYPKAISGYYRLKQVVQKLINPASS